MIEFEKPNIECLEVDNTILNAWKQMMQIIMQNSYANH